MDEKYVGEIVQLKYGTGELKEIAFVVGYTKHPTFLVEKETGEQFSWIAGLSEPISDKQKIEYWKNRALLSEGNKKQRKTE